MAAGLRIFLLAARVSTSLGATAQGLLSASAGFATIDGSAAGGAIAGASGIAGNFAAWAMAELIGAGILGYAVLGDRAGIGPARDDREPLRAL